jgi:two-component system, OmpR family, phosphate regulon sensor histidine kinase PhoR
MRLTRLFWTFFVGSCLSTGLLTLSLVAVATQYLHSREQGRDATQFDAMAGIVEVKVRRWSDSAARDPNALARLVQDVADATSLSAAVVGQDGQVWADSELSPAEWKNQRNRPEIQQAIRTDRGGEDVRRAEHSGEMTRYRAWPILPREGSEEPMAFLRLGWRLTETPSEFFRSLALIGGSGVMLWGVSLVAQYYWLGATLAPLEQLVQFSRGLAAGEENLQFPQQRTDEIGALAAVFRDMQAIRADRRDQLQEKSELLGSVLGNMLEGVVAVGWDDTVLVANAASGRMLGFSAENASGRVLLELTRCRPLHDAVQQAVTTGKPVNQEIEAPGVKRRILAIRAAPLVQEPRQGVMVVIHDVTELRRLENLRREFVANVSHELKTPLASIKAYSETLRLGAIEDEEHRLGFVARIEEQAERLHELIVDLLHLARVEAGKEAFEIVPLEIRSLAEECLHQYSPVAAAKDIALDVSPGLTEVTVRADEEGLRTILNNLVDNAIKYTPPGGRVRVSWSVVGSWAELMVEDSGIGIAPRDQSRVFERFYRVDKARSRELGGTGLGLSIVKHLAQAFGGDVGIRSRLGEGSTFSVKLPLGSRAGGFAK